MFVRSMQLPSAASASRPARRSARGRGFSFVEILFAVAVLGIGFIMLAAIFPVGLQQTKLTLDETTAAGNARAAVATLAQLAQVQTQYLDVGTVAANDANSTAIFPATYANAWPAVGTALNQVPAGGSRTFPGQVRSLRDPRNFADAWHPVIADANPARQPQYPTAQEMKATPQNAPVLRRDAIWNRVNSELLSKSNDRNAFVILYKRDTTFTAPINATAGSPADLPKPSDSVQLIVINTQVAAQSAYTARDSSGGNFMYNLEPRPVLVTIEADQNGSGSYIATFGGASGVPPTVPTPVPPALDHKIFPASPVYAATPNAVAEGAFVVISDDRITTPGLAGRMNGRIYRLGNYRTDTNPVGWELAPGSTFVVDGGLDGVPYNGASSGPGSVKDDITAIGYGPKLPGNGATIDCDGPAVAYIVGRGFADPAVVPTNQAGYAGLAQDVAIYTTFVAAK